VTLAEACRQTCQTYLPRWRAATAWSLEERPCTSWLQAQGKPRLTAAQGVCDPPTRRIFLPVASENVLQRQAMLMHAICHAITTVGHGARFRAQMGQAAARAWTVGATALAEALRRQAYAYRSLGGLTTCEAHTSMLPPAPYEQLREPPWFLITARGTYALDSGTPSADTRESRAWCDTGWDSGHERRTPIVPRYAWDQEETRDRQRGSHSRGGVP
jgi:hypothetical protein